MLIYVVAWLEHLAFTSMTYLTKKIADKKMRKIDSVGADIVATGCPGCELQLIDGAVRNGMPIKVKHIMELLQ